MPAEIVAGDAQPRLAGVIEGERIDRFGFVLAVCGGADDFALLAGQDEAQPAVVGGRAQLGILVGVVQVIGLAIDAHPDQRRLEGVRQRERVMATLVMPAMGGRPEARTNSGWNPAAASMA